MHADPQNLAAYPDANEMDWSNNIHGSTATIKNQ